MRNSSLRWAGLFVCVLAISSAYADAAKSVRAFGAVGNGLTDDAAAFQKAIDATPPGQTLYVPAGVYLLKSTLKMTRAITIVGVGLGSQLFGDFDGSLIQVSGVKAGAIRDLFLGSRATNPNTGLLELVSTERSEITNITMFGGAAGLLLRGSGGNVFTDIRSGNNFQNQYVKATSASANQVWIHAVGSTSNTFVASVLEGGGAGMLVEEPAGSCSGLSCSSPMRAFGTTAEGVSGTGLTFSQVSAGAILTGTYLESNGVQLVVSDSSNLTFSGILAVTGGAVRITSTGSGKTSNVKIEEGYIDSLTVDPGPQNIQLENIVMPPTSTFTLSSGVISLNVAKDGD